MYSKSAYAKLGIAAVRSLSADTCGTTLSCLSPTHGKPLALDVRLSSRRCSRMGIRLAICEHTQRPYLRAGPDMLVDRCTLHIWDIFSSTEYPGKWKDSDVFKGLTFYSLCVLE
jgi:hypothetical protein